MLTPKWIAPEGAESMKPCHFRANKYFTLNAIPENTLLEIASETYYRLEINGICVGRSSARGSSTMNFVDTYYVNNYLRIGENKISVLVCCMNIACEGSFPAAPGVWLKMGNILATDENWETIICSNEWPVGGPFYTGMLGFTELQDCRAVDIPGKTIAYPDDSEIATKGLVHRETPKPIESTIMACDMPVAAFVPKQDLNDLKLAALSTNEEHFPVSPELFRSLYKLTLGGSQQVELPVPADDRGLTMVFDFQHQITGRVEIDITVENGDGVVADMAFEEELWNGDRLRADHTHTNPTYQFAERHILKQGRQTTGPVLLEHGFRLVQLTLRNFGQCKVTLHSVRAIDRRYPFPQRATFYCGDSTLNRLWDISRETVSACITDIFTDCPWRERLFYCNDMLVENRSALKLFGDARLSRHAFALIFSQRRPDGFYTSTCPSRSAKDGFVPGKCGFEIILSGNLTLPLALLDYWMHTGDEPTVRKYYPYIKDLLGKFHEWLDNGVLLPLKEYWNFTDWSYELNGMGFSGKKTAMLNFLYLMARKAARKLATAMGEPVNPAELEEDKFIAEKSCEMFWNAEHKYFNNSTDEGKADAAYLKRLGVVVNYQITPTSRLPHAFALLAEAVPENIKDDVVAALLNDDLLSPELYYWIFLLDAMQLSGKEKELFQSIRKYWGPVLDSGSPTIWENGVHARGKAGFGGSASLCHGFSTAPVANLQQSVLGVTPVEPGFARFRFDPRCPEMRFAKGNVPTPFGAIRVDWHAENGTIQATLVVPPECTADTPAGSFNAGTHTFSYTWK